MVQEFVIATLPQVANTDVIRRSEQLGFTHHGVGDGPLLFSDPWTFLGAAVPGTSSIKVGTLVTNPLTRIPAVTANALATLNQIAPGRVFCGIGAANNATRSMGTRIGKLDEIEVAVQQIKALTSGGRIVNDWLGDERDIEFLCNPDHGWLNIADPIEVWWAAGGPKSIYRAAKYADAIVYPTGVHPDLISLVRRLIDEAAAAHGRSGADIKLVGLAWFHLRKPGDSVEDAMRDGFSNGAVISAHTNLNLMRQHRDELGDQICDFAEASAASYTPLDGEAPPNYLDVYRTHANGVISPRHIEITTELAARYFCLWGDPDEIAEQVQGMRDAGCERPCVFLANPLNYDRDIDQLGQALNGARV
jgi:alkanesulfonate monooxygenase SsuD/methylene tetrahydromethanopterin reductase-like flavin-dependent oxidoreductase (luciferase family)